MVVERDVEKIGPHQLWVEEPLVIWMELEGDVTGSDMDGILAFFEKALPREGRVVVVQNLAKVRTFTPDARRKIAHSKLSRRVSALVYIGASFQMQVVMKMIDTAVRLFSKAVAKIHFVETKEEAVAKMRAEVNLLAPPPVRRPA